MTSSGKGAVVTGGGRGIGAAVARALAEDHAAVVVVARTESELEAVAAGLRARGCRAEAIVCDVSDPVQVARLADAAGESLGRVDILVNGAGIASSAPLVDLSFEEWNRVMAVNATGTYLCTRAFLGGMVERGWGRVVNIASVAGLSGARYIAAYAASKHAVIGLTRCVAAEVADTGVTVNAVCPGYVDTPMTEATLQRIVDKTGRSREEALTAVLDTSSQSRLIGPAEVAREVLALCQQSAVGINGESIVIDAGGRQE